MSLVIPLKQAIQWKMGLCLTLSVWAFSLCYLDEGWRGLRGGWIPPDLINVAAGWGKRTFCKVAKWIPTQGTGRSAGISYLINAQPQEKLCFEFVLVTKVSQCEKQSHGKTKELLVFYFVFCFCHWSDSCYILQLLLWGKRYKNILSEEVGLWGLGLG